MTKALRQPEGLDVTRPSPARIYDYMLRGNHHFDVDADAGERLLTVVPEIRDCAWSNRGFHQRAAAWIARQGIRQFLDLGSGLPTVGSPEPMSRNCLTPWFAIQAAARWWKPRLDQAQSLTSGTAARMRWAAAASTSK